MNGKVISFEGINGVGKTTLIKEFVNYLDRNQIKYIQKVDLREYTGAVVNNIPPTANLGREIASLLNKYAFSDPFYRIGFPLVETYLILAKRSFDAKMRLVPALQSNCLVICDRDIDTVCSHQLASISQHVPNVDFTSIINTIRFFDSLSISSPSVTFFLEANINVCKKRHKEDPYREELTPQSIQYLKRIMSHYEQCFEIHIPGRQLERIDAAKSKEKVLYDVIRKFEKWLEQN
jgi:dTMP kinase